MKKKQYIIICLLSCVFSLYTIAQTYQGIGARVTKADGAIIILEVFPGSPAERQGLQRGDRITSIEGVPTEGLSLEEGVSKLQGAAGTKINVELEERGTVSLERGHIRTPEPDRQRAREQFRRMESSGIPMPEGIILSLEIHDIASEQNHYEICLALNAYNPRYDYLQDGNIYIRIPHGFQLNNSDFRGYPLQVQQLQDILHIAPERPFQIMAAREILGIITLTTPTLPDTLRARFLFETDYFTSLSDPAGNSILGSRISSTNGVIHLNSSIRHYFPESSAQNVLLLSLSAPKETEVNEPAWGHFKISNPDHVSFNFVDIVVTYGGVKVDFEDIDEGNPITMGLNVWDGPYKEDFPFTEHYRNRIDTRQQIITYRMGTSRSFQGEGKLFSFRFIPRQKGDLVFNIKAETAVSLNRSDYNLQYEPAHVIVR